MIPFRRRYQFVVAGKQQNSSRRLHIKTRARALLIVVHAVILTVLAKSWLQELDTRPVCTVLTILLSSEDTPHAGVGPRLVSEERQR